MKKGILILFAVGFSYVAMSQTKETETPIKTRSAIEKSEKSNEAKPITFKTTVIERKDIVKGTNDMFSFEFKNTGKTPVLIQNVQTSCGCTTAHKPEAPIAPGKSAEISVKYDTNRIGLFEKTITVTSNVGDPIVLTIKGNVLGDATQPSGQVH